MGDKTIKTVLSAVRMLVIVLGALLCVMITSKSGADETFVEGQERYGGLLDNLFYIIYACLLYTSPSPRDRTRSRMPSSA